MFEIAMLGIAAFCFHKVYSHWKETTRRDQAIRMMEVAHRTGNPSIAPPPEAFLPKPGGGMSKRLLIFAACLAYCLSPVDILPEAMLGPFGLPDDFIAGIVGLRALFTRGK